MRTKKSENALNQRNSGKNAALEKAKKEYADSDEAKLQQKQNKKQSIKAMKKRTKQIEDVSVMHLYD